MGASASVSVSPRTIIDEDSQVGLFSMIQREYEQMAQEQLADDIVFERMKQVW